MTAKRQPGRQLEPPGAAEALLAAYYYERLLADCPEFAQDLKRLYHVLDAALAAGPPSGIGAGIDGRGLLQLGPQGLLAHAGAEGQWVATQAEHAQTAGRWVRTWAGARDVPELSPFAEQAAQGWLRLGQGHLAQVLQALAERRRALSVAAEVTRREALATFARRWPLPAGAVEDLAHSFQLWRLARPDVPPLLPTVLVAELCGEAVSPVRLPPLPPAIAWSPVEGRAVMWERLAELWRQLAADVARQIDAREQAAAGWREPPTRPADLALRTERLFRRAVLRESWAKIRNETGASDRALVRRQVVADAALLGIPLP